MRELVSIQDLREILSELRNRVNYVRGQEEVELLDALDRELAEDIYSEVELPQYDIATMDGFAINSSHPGPYRLVSEVYAGAEKELELKEGETVYITTGAKMPGNTNAVLKIEVAEVKNGLVHPKERVSAGKYVLKKGSEVRKGELILRRGRKLRPTELAVLKNIGKNRVKVYRRLRVAVFSNGDEIKRGLVRDTNSIMIQAFLMKWGCETHFLGVVGDDYSAIADVILRATEEYDVVMTSGGVSVGKRDYVVQVLNDIGEVIIRRVKQRPGKPLTIAIVNEKPVFALPGKPSGAFVALLSLKNFFTGETHTPRIRAKMARRVVIPTEGFKYILFAKIRDGYAFPVGYEGSNVDIMGREGVYEVSLISSMTRTMLADGYIITDRDIESGEEVDVNLI
jgi:molybdenum cofactor synthesis domain-containing protein